MKERENVLEEDKVYWEKIKYVERDKIVLKEDKVWEKKIVFWMNNWKDKGILIKKYGWKWKKN